MIGLRPPSSLDEYFGAPLSSSNDDACGPGGGGLAGLFSGLPLDGSLKEWGVGYEELPLSSDGAFRLDAIDQALATDPTVRG